MIRCSFKPLRCLRASAWNNLVEPHSWVGARPEAAFPAFTASAGLGLKPTVLQQLYQELGNVTQMQQARRRRLLCSVSVCVTVRLQTRRYAACSDHRGRYAACSDHRGRYAACSDHRGRYAACSDHRGRYAACVSLGEPLRGIRYRLTPESGRFSRVAPSP